MAAKRTRAERRESVVRMLTEDPKRPDRAIARATSASHTLVGQVRRELVSAGKIAPRSCQPETATQQGHGNLTRQTAGEPSPAVTHGAYSAKALASRVEELTDELRGVVPGAKAADDTAIRLLALLLAQIEAVNAWIAERGLFKRAGRGEPQPILAMQTRWIGAAAKLCDQLGLTPTARARLGVVRDGEDAYAHYLEITQGKDLK